MLSAKELRIGGPIYSMFGKDNSIIYLGQLEQREKHPRGYVLVFENIFQNIIVNNLEDKLFFIEPPSFCDELGQDVKDDCCCCCFTTTPETPLIETVNNIYMWGIIYSEK